MNIYKIPQLRSAIAYLHNIIASKDVTSNLLTRRWFPVLYKFDEFFDKLKRHLQSSTIIIYSNVEKPFESLFGFHRVLPILRLAEIHVLKRKNGCSL